MAKTIGSFDLASLKVLRDDVTQYFWFEPDSSSAWGSGAHVTLYPESQFTDSTSPNYMKGQNIIMNTDGFSIRNGALPMMVLDNDSLDFNAVDTIVGTYTTMATFGLTGATIGKTSGAHIQISSSGLDVNLNSSTNIANFGTSGAVLGKATEGKITITDDGLKVYGYSNGTQQLLAQLKYAIGKNIGYQDEVAPHFILGTRDTSKTIGNWSFSGGYNSNACYYCSFAFGKNASANSLYAMAFGESVSANSSNSFAFGTSSEANATCSEAHGLHTTADGRNQTVFGVWNKSDTSNEHALIVGNGVVNGRSNAFAVDWNGGAHLAGSLFTGCNANSTGGYEFGRKTGNHVVIGGIHVCWGRETISHTGSGYKEVQVTLPYTYTSAPYCFASYGNRPLGGAARTAYATQSNLAGNKIYVGSYATGSVDAYVNWMTIGV